MSELSLFSNGSQLPAHLRNVELDATTKALMGSGSSMKRISFKGGTFRMIAGGKEIAQNDDRAMNIIILKAAEKESRTFYAGSYTEGQSSAPTCWSNDGDKPDKTIADPQSSNCANCQQNIKGSGQGDSRACRFSQRLAVTLENNLDGDIYQVTLAATSIFGDTVGGKMPLKAYAKFVGGHGINITNVVTEMRFDTASSTPKLTFRAVRALTADELETCREQANSPDVTSAIVMTVAQTDGIKHETPLFAKTEPVKAAEVIAEPTVETSPTKRATKKVETKDITDTLDKWADDE